MDHKSVKPNDEAPKESPAPSQLPKDIANREKPASEKPIPIDPDKTPIVDLNKTFPKAQDPKHPFPKKPSEDPDPTLGKPFEKP